MWSPDRGALTQGGLEEIVPANLTPAPASLPCTCVEYLFPTQVLGCCNVVFFGILISSIFIEGSGPGMGTGHTGISFVFLPWPRLTSQ